MEKQLKFYDWSIGKRSTVKTNAKIVYEFLKKNINEEYSWNGTNKDIANATGIEKNWQIYSALDYLANVGLIATEHEFTKGRFGCLRTIILQ